MATSVSSLRSHISGTQLTRTLERVLEDAQITGELNLSGRKLKEFTKIASKYKLGDTVNADLSRNKFLELPLEICEFISLEKVNCYNNVIRTIPDAVIQLQSLTHINLSRNQLTTLPEALCKLYSLQVLLLGNNKLVSLPEEIHGLERLMELDVSCNEISYLPPQIEQLENLRSLDIRRNLLVELPVEITRLRLVKLDISGNRISILPSELRLMDCLLELSLHNNPLTSPPSYLCTRGRVHIFKYLEIQAIKEDRKRGIIDSEISHSGRPRWDSKLCSLSLNQRNKRYTIDSGYNTSEGSEKRWSQDSQDLSIDVEVQNIALRHATTAKEQRQEKKRAMQRHIDHLKLNNVCPESEISIFLHGPLNSPTTPSTLSPGADSLYEDPLKNEVEEKLENEDSIISLQKRLENGEKYFHEHWKSNHLNEDDKDIFQKRNNKTSSTSNPSDLKTSSLDSNSFWNASDIETASDIQKPFPHIQTYREYKEALRQQRAAENYKINRRPMTEGAASVISDGTSIQDELSYPHSNSSGSVATNHMTPQEEFQVRHSALMQEQHYQALLTQKRLEERRKQKEAVLSYFKSRTSPPWNPEKTQNINGYGVTDITENGSSRWTQKLASSTSFCKKFESINPNFTMRREFDKAKEEAELIQQLRQAIEARLKVTLPENVSAALMDGVVLCHLANHIRPRSVASIHVPSPAVPKLTMAKCRKNVENFLEACRNIGVDEDYICSAHDILEEKSAACVAITVQELLKFHSVSCKRTA